MFLSFTFCDSGSLLKSRASIGGLSEPNLMDQTLSTLAQTVPLATSTLMNQLIVLWYLSSGMESSKLTLLF
jgi:hypothetical protein